MKPIDNEQVERILEDISSIKEVINRNRCLLREVFNFTHFRLFMLLSGISVIGFSMLFYFLMNSYGNYGAIPARLKWIIYIAMAIDAGFLQIMKQRLISSSLKKIDQGLTLSWWLKELFSNRLIHLSFSITFLVLFLTVFFIIKGIPYFIIPTISICFYGVSGILGAMVDIKHSLIIGYWFFFTGICLIIFNTIPMPIAISITLGAGCLIMALLGYMDQDSGKAE